MGYQLELQLVKTVSNPETHQYTFEAPKSNWDYTDINNDYEVINVLNQSFFMDIAVSWKEGDFLRKTDGRCYSGEEGYEKTIYKPEDILRFIEKMEKALPTLNIPAYEEHYFIPNKNGKIEINEELEAVKAFCLKARSGNYSLKCLDR